MYSSLFDKLNNDQLGVYLIGTTPPKIETSTEEVKQIATKFLSRLQNIEYDGTIVYDLQDESSRNNKPRPFPFKQTIDPCNYGNLLSNLSKKDTIIYKSVTQNNKESFNKWLTNTQKKLNINNLVLVGCPSSQQKILFKLSDAYKEIKNKKNTFHLGGITVAERHKKKNNEHDRLIQKIQNGCNFFISQAVYNPQFTIDLLTRYSYRCQELNIKPKRIILTFTPCGSLKTLEFMEWLGIDIPEATKWRLSHSKNMLYESILICKSNLNLILESCGYLNIPLGLNIESLTNRKKDIDTSIHLYQILKATLELHLAQKTINSLEDINII